MKAFFDTSVLVAVFYGDHVHHDASLALFIQFARQQGAAVRTVLRKFTPL